MPLLALPNELLLKIARCLLKSQTCHCDCDCHWHHMSPHLSAFSRSNHRLYALLTEYLLANASTLHILFWAVANSRNDTVALALERGADPNSPLGPNSHIITSWNIRTTPLDLAISMRVHSVDAKSHALKLGTLALLFGAGGTCDINSLIMPIRYGDLDLLTLCLPHLTDSDNPNRQSWPRVLLEVASRHGHVEAAKMAIDAGATVNSIGDHNHPEFYPPLWVCWRAPIAVLQLLLDAGADPTWHARHGVSVAQNMRHRSINAPELEEKIALLVRYGAVDKRTFQDTFGSGGRRQRHPPEREYRGWVPGSSKVPVDWPREWVQAGREDGCECLSC